MFTRLIVLGSVGKVFCGLRVGVGLRGMAASIFQMKRDSGHACAIDNGALSAGSIGRATPSAPALAPDLHLDLHLNSRASVPSTLAE